uniref:Uncharacterized protein n=1 Tax=Romanomermis culicivorax TaxID=13658 RepID=A0A915I042_ROMCU
MPGQEGNWAVSLAIVLQINSLDIGDLWQLWEWRVLQGHFLPTREIFTISVATIWNGCVGCIANRGGDGNVCGKVNWQILQDLIYLRRASSILGHQK